MPRIVVDAMGGDENIPQMNIEGSLFALKESPKLTTILVGPKKLIDEKIKELRIKDKSLISRIEVVDVEEMVLMDEQPSKALRNKKNSTISIGIKTVKEGKADAFVSAGNSGAVAAFALIELGAIKSISRPAIATILPTLLDRCIMLDAGANVDCKPKQILDFAYMGTAYAKIILKKENPTVGLLSIGHEEGKGNSLTTESYDLLKNSGINFIGNIEGKDIPIGKVDVVVCDGFVGNAILKFGEGVVSTLLTLIKDSLKKHPLTFVSLPFIWGAIKDLKKKYDFTEYGGAPLLGLEKICVICHGRSNSKAIKNAIKTAAQLVENNVNKIILDFFNGAKQ